LAAPVDGNSQPVRENEEGASGDPHHRYKRVAWWRSRPGDSGPRWRLEFLDEAAIGARRKVVGAGGARIFYKTKM
jgi:hypothetical protein